MHEIEEQIVSVEGIMQPLKKRWLMILLVTLTVVIFSAFMSYYVIKPRYQASTKVFIGKESTDIEYNNNDVQMYQRLLTTYAETLKTKDLINRAIQSTGINISTSEVLKSLTVEPMKETQLVKIKYQGFNPEDTANILRAISNEFINVSNELFPNGNVKIMETVEVPKKPVSPNKQMNIVLAFLLGIMGSIGLAYLLEYLDTTYTSTELLEHELGIPVLGAVPNVKIN